MRSMTGFGRGEAEKDGKKLTIELKTVNHRFLDINIRIPRTLGFAEESIRKIIKERLTRGRVDIFVNYSTMGEGAKIATADMGFIRAYLDAARTAADNAGIDDDIKLSDIIRIPDAIVIEESGDDEASQIELIKNALHTALDALTDMRDREGTSLKDNIFECLDALMGIVLSIEQRKDIVVIESGKKLKQRIQELLESNDIDENRFNAEVAYIADKADITEEVVRLNTHINQFKKVVNEVSAIGRKLDFMVQEMNRELNTIGSKSQDIKITNAVIEGKSLVEKIREQVQNIE